MLVLILIDVQYSQKSVSSFKKGLNGQNHSSPGSHCPVKIFPPAKFLIPPSPFLIAIWKTLQLILNFFFFFGLILQELCDFGFWAVNWAPKWSKIVNFGCVPFKPKWNILIDFPNTVFVLLEATSVQNFSKIKQNLVD